MRSPLLVESHWEPRSIRSRRRKQWLIFSNLVSRCEVVIPRALSPSSAAVGERGQTRKKRIMVYVLDTEGKPLMPTKRCGWVAYALKHGEAKVVRREPFTIKLLRDSTPYRQGVTLNVDVESRRGCKHNSPRLAASTVEECNAALPPYLRDNAVVQREIKLMYKLLPITHVQVR